MPRKRSMFDAGKAGDTAATGVLRLMRMVAEVIAEPGCHTKVCEFAIRRAARVSDEHDYAGQIGKSTERYTMSFSRFGGDLLSHALRRSTIGAVALNDRFRNGAGCFANAMTTKPRKRHRRMR